MINNYSHIGFLPGNSLQTSELNEIQERFYLDQTLNSFLIGNWLIYSSDYSYVTGSTMDTYDGLSVNGIIPSNPNQIEIYYDNENIIVNMNSGWYRINHTLTNNISMWVFLDNQITNTLSLTTEDGLYLIFVNINFEEIECSSDENDEGYSLNSNSGGFIEPWIPGSNRFKLSISDFKILKPFEQEFNDIPIAKIRKGIDSVPSDTFLIQYTNNFKINEINIS